MGKLQIPYYVADINLGTLTLSLQTLHCWLQFKKISAIVFNRHRLNSY